ncbi:sorting and assembly machinery component 50 [Acrasis kona]|uniref:Sorting and assembly machinery component 50 n=1 Tax=Acrasis kona TaxID=1008807 RepID=A0AAW2ZH66_9EUKA
MPGYDALELHKIKKSEPVRVSGISCFGLNRTKQATLLGGFDKLKDATNIEELHEAIHDGITRNNQLEIFEGIQVVLDSVDQNSDDVNVIINVKEKETTKNYSIGAEYDPKTQEVPLKAAFRLKNFLGRGDSFSLSAQGINSRVADVSLKRWRELPSLSRQWLNDIVFGGSLVVPRLFGRSSSESIGASVGTHSLTEFMSVRFTSLVIASLLNERHKISYQLESRQLKDTKKPAVTLSDEVGGEVTEQVKRSHLWPVAGPVEDLKSSITHEYRLCTLDNLVAPNNGSNLRTKLTLAGIGGNVNHALASFNYSAYKSLLKTFLVGALDLSFAHIIPTSADQNISLCDRLFERVRGYRCVGDFDRVSLEQKGGNFAMSAAAKLIMKSEKVDELLSGVSLRGQVFINAGNVVNLEGEGTKRYTEDALKQFIQDAQASFGVGLLIGLGVAKVEVNYGVPYYLTKDSFPGDHQKHFSKFSAHVTFDI